MEASLPGKLFMGKDLGGEMTAAVQVRLLRAAQRKKAGEVP